MICKPREWAASTFIQKDDNSLLQPKLNKIDSKAMWKWQLSKPYLFHYKEAASKNEKRTSIMGVNAQEVETKCIFGITRFPVQTEGKEFKGRKWKMNTADATKRHRNQRSLGNETYNKFCTINFLRTNQRQDRHLVVYGYKNKVDPKPIHIIIQEYHL